MLWNAAQRNLKIMTSKRVPNRIAQGNITIYIVRAIGYSNEDKMIDCPFFSFSKNIETRYLSASMNTFEIGLTIFITVVKLPKKVNCFGRNSGLMIKATERI